MNWRYIETELAQAILAKNIRRIGQITDWMRYEAKLNYDQQYALARKVTGYPMRMGPVALRGRHISPGRSRLNVLLMPLE